jgi:peptide/nickel transport system ATP-binding protein
MKSRLAPFVVAAVAALAATIIGLLPKGGRVDSGIVLFDGRDLLTLPERALESVRGRGIGLRSRRPA